jgi:serine/threonine-protein kinase
MNRCPSAEQLERWLNQPADDAAAQALAAHVDACPHCQQALEALTAGPAVPLTESFPEPLPTIDGRALGGLKDAPAPPGPAGSADRTALETLPPPRTSAGARCRLEQETRDLLLRRLRVFSLILTSVYLTLGLLSLRGWGSPHGRYADALGASLLTGGLLGTLACAAVVWARPTLSLRALRTVELLLFGATAAFFAKHRYTALTRGPDGAWEGPSHRDLFVAQATLINNAFWNFAIISYGVFIPNTWRRCVAMVLLLALLPVAITVAAGLAQPAVGDRLDFLLSFTVLGLVVSSALAVFGSFKIRMLQEEALAARQLGQYVLKERLGAGGMGEVYLAEHRLLKRPCAVKIIRPERARDPNLLRRFEREVQATARLRHYHTVEIYDYGHSDDGTFYYVMEYLPGLTLEEVVERHGPLPAARVVHYLRQLCGALREAHAAGLVHRDIKPSNVIAGNPGGAGDVVKLVDFGLVRPPDVGGETRLTKEGLILGTPEFMSPEQAKGEDSLDARSDLYSLGAVAYFLLTGRSPFEGRSPLETLLAHLHEPPPPPAGGPEVPADVQAVILRCLAKDPEQRFADAEALDRALAHCACAGQWTEAQARAWWQMARDTAPRTKPTGADRSA